MLDAIKQLLDSNVITEDTHDAINEAWEQKLSEAREELKVELREEMAQRYEHDKKLMVEALNKMVTDSLTEEIREFVEEKKALSNDRVKFQKQMQENAKKFNNFLTARLAEEIRDLREDRRQQKEQLKKLESFVVKKLTEEIKDFAQDKQDVIETKVKLVSEASEQLLSLKKRFVANAKKQVQEHVTKRLTAELTALNEDIKAARENSFGRKIFETFASEFAATLLNENAEIRKLRGEITKRDNQLKESINHSKKLETLVESKKKELHVLNENNKRSELMKELLGPLNEEKAEIMRNLLESVQTSRLQKAFDKYLPAVLNGKQETKKPLNESRKEITGNKQTANAELDDEDNNIIALTKLAGL